MATMLVEVGDITKLQVDVIVNAANKSLLGGGGVDGAIHRAAGPELLEFCRSLRGCRVGEAKLSPGFRLPASWVVHTVGPIYHSGKDKEAEKLAACYRNSLTLALEKGVSSIAFPAISTGVYRYPKREAAEIAVSTVRDFLAEYGAPETVIFCCFDEQTAAIYLELTANS